MLSTVQDIVRYSTVQYFAGLQQAAVLSEAGETSGEQGSVQR